MVRCTECFNFFIFACQALSSLSVLRPVKSERSSILRRRIRRISQHCPLINSPKQCFAWLRFFTDTQLKIANFNFLYQSDLVRVSNFQYFEKIVLCVQFMYSMLYWTPLLAFVLYYCNPLGVVGTGLEFIGHPSRNCF